ncbi:MAG: UDP-3-O-(3-hydroxymyristoyl)glucosamine N-acyltransferase [Myxococcota bacterium]|nr:UDP-3-O-(3-hydroxymyristoyl)glucosamine N-acyltransferase [Myxococcota bacterium]
MSTAARTRTTIGAVAQALELPLEGTPDLEITGLAGLDDAGPADLSFVSAPKHARAYAASGAGACIVFSGFDAAERPCLRSASPYADFARAIELLYPPRRPDPGVHPSAIVPEDVRLGRDVSIGAYTVIGSGCTIGDASVIHPHVTLYADVVVGRDCEIHAGARLREGTRLGDRVVIENGVVLGSYGFGHAFRADGTRVTIPHVSPVDLGDDTEIGANSTIDASHPGHPRMGHARTRTRIGRGVKLDNLVQIAHGCTVEDGTVVCAQSALAGSTWVGKRVIFGGQSASGGHLRVGDDSQVGARAALAGDLPARSQVLGTPAMPRRLWVRYSVARQYLPGLLRRVRRIEEKLGLGEQKPRS